MMVKDGLKLPDGAIIFLRPIAVNALQYLENYIWWNDRYSAKFLHYIYRPKIPKPEPWRISAKLLTKIFRYLSMENLKSASLVCKAWYHAALSNDLWEDFLLGYVRIGFNELPQDEIVKKWFFVKYHQSKGKHILV